ncbi:MAG TPA: sensor histidine kinase [Chloroflexota bacterium]|nr:sensor histidine kinase [Chloroflexota bacterium]
MGVTENDLSDGQTTAREPATVEAATAFRSVEARLHDLLQETRDEQARFLEKLREVEWQLGTTAARIDALADEAQSAGVDAAKRELEASVLREKHEALRARRAAIGERLSQLQLAVRKLRSVITQAQMSADYLGGGFGDTDEDLLSLTQVWALEAQEEERRRLAREIHDGPAQVLANATFQLEYCQRLLERDPSRLQAELQRLGDDLRDGLAEVRYFIFDLRPGPLAELGLSATLQRYAENFQQRSGIEVELDLEFEQARLSPTKEMAVFRIVQEALQNVRKHSGARHARVALATRHDGLHVSVTDDGVGFDSSRRAETGGRHFGLSSMEERARLIRAELHVTSKPGQGTSVNLRVPTDAAGEER